MNLVFNEDPIILLGNTGQVGRAIKYILGNKVIDLGRDKVDFAEPEAVRRYLDSLPAPQAIINAAAYTAVDKAEKEPEIAMKVNADSVEVIADYAARNHVPLVHFSTDYVFDGKNDNIPWKETDKTNPINVYGKTKLAGEKAIQKRGGRYFIFRTSWVYDAEGHNFANTMLNLGASREQLKVVGDQFGSPTYAPHLAHAALQALSTSLQGTHFPSGTYHLCNTGVTNWHQFAKEIFNQAHHHAIPLAINQIDAITTKEYPTPAKRPANSRLDCSLMKDTFDITMPSWQKGLNDFFNIIQSRII